MYLLVQWQWAIHNIKWLCRSSSRTIGTLSAQIVDGSVPAAAAATTTTTTMMSLSAAASTVGRVPLPRPLFTNIEIHTWSLSVASVRPSSPNTLLYVRQGQILPAVDPATPLFAFRSRPSWQRRAPIGCCAVAVLPLQPATDEDAYNRRLPSPGPSRW